MARSLHPINFDSIAGDDKQALKEAGTAFVTAPASFAILGGS
jgi:hypothetical protein